MRVSSERIKESLSLNMSSSFEILPFFVEMVQKLKQCCVPKCGELLLLSERYSDTKQKSIIGYMNNRGDFCDERDHWMYGRSKDGYNLPIYASLLCKEHICSALGCAQYKNIESTYCWKHQRFVDEHRFKKCEEIECMYFKLEGLQVCEVHKLTCIVSGCFCPKIEGKFYCEIHETTESCLEPGCSLPLGYGWSSCSREQPRLGHPRTCDESHYCEYHIRARNDMCAVHSCPGFDLSNRFCRKTRNVTCHGTYSTIFCVRHTCPPNCPGQCWKQKARGVFKKNYTIIKGGYCRNGGLFQE